MHYDILKLRYTIKSLIILFLFACLTFQGTIKAQSDWRERESEHFKIIYNDSLSYLVPHILANAENALDTLMYIFNYKPHNKIILSTYDIYDYGSGISTTVPTNYIRLDIEPLEQGYETVPLSDRFQWMIDHELTHIVVNDQANKFESVMRTLFGKVSPEQEEPITIPFSLLTNYDRYTQRWYQEGIAVFMETWLTGGFGRTFGSFDEMYFRCMVEENKDFPYHLTLETTLPNRSFLLNIIFYLYGTRFTSYLAIEYGAGKLIKWYSTSPNSFYEGNEKRFREVFGIDLDDAWENFLANEKEFQQQNIKKLKLVGLTPIKKLTASPVGWTTEPYLDENDSSVIFGFHHPDHLASIERLSLLSNNSETIGTLPTPSILQIASTAYDKNLKLLFYTTNNNELYRDIWCLDTSTKETRLLFNNYRIGDLSVSPDTHDLWGTMHSNGRVSITFSPYPYKEMYSIVTFNEGIEINDLSISSSGKYIAAVLHKNNGEQSVIVADCDIIKKEGRLKYETISSLGSPENPSWSPDEKYIFWNAFTNGVSNIYRIDVESKKIEAISNVVEGLFRPMYISQDSLFAFEFTADGFVPVLIPNKPASKLPAIEYLGQQVVDKNPYLKNFAIDPLKKYAGTISEQNTYNSLNNLHINTLIPVISGFQNEKVLGFYTHITDPLRIHDISLEFGISPFNKNIPRYHLKAKYNFRNKFQFNFDYNAPDFYDLFNERKRGMIGTKISFENTHYWVYDNPLKIKQVSSISLYKDVKSINDNLVDVSQPDFLVLQSDFNASNVRRSIGSSGNEEGNEFGASFMAFGARGNNVQTSSQLYGEWDNYSTWLIPHNVFHFKLATGYNFQNENLQQAQFFFGGFGNRRVEDTKVDQFRDVFRFPGLPIYSIPAERFIKLMFESNLPPLRFNHVSLASHYLYYIDLSIYSQNLFVESPIGTYFTDLGAQVNFVFEHWFNLESTFSAGIAKAWYGSGHSSEWFMSFKLLKNL